MSSQRCLNRVIHDAIRAWAKQHGERDEAGIAMIDASYVIAKLSEVTAEYAHWAPTRAQRRQFDRFARECLEAALKSAVTGETVTVDPGDPETEH
jgi:hypothetical protein